MPVVDRLPTRRQNRRQNRRSAAATPRDSLVVVTGAAGFLGSHLCDRLLERGYEVLGLDNLSTGCRENLMHLQGAGHFRFIEHDITEPPPGEADAAARIFNLACPASPAHYQDRPVQTTLASTLGIYHLLKLARRTGARRE